MNNDDLLKQIKKLIKPLETGQEQLKQTVGSLELKVQSLDSKVNKLDLKIDDVNNNINNKSSELMDFITDILHTASTQKQVDDHEERIVILEEKTGARI